MLKRLISVAIAVFFILSVSAAFGADKIKIGVSIPSADHGWTGGIVWWAKKAIGDW